MSIYATRQGKKLRGKYYTLDPNIRLHLTPEFGYLSYDLNAISDEKERAMLKKTPSMVINETAKYLLSHANGQYTIGQVIEKYSAIQGPPKDGFDKKLTDFFRMAQKHKQITLHDQVTPVPMTVFGSEEAWYPLNAAIEITDNCNLKCKHCYRYHSDNNKASKPHHFDTEQCIKVIRTLSENGAFSLELTGGEPFTHPQFKTIFETAVENFSLLSILTNGVLITPELCDYMAQFADKVRFCISLDGANAVDHDKIRGNGAFKATTTAIRGLTSRNVKVRAGITLMKENIRDFENILLLSQELGCQNAAFNPVLPFGRGAKLNEDLSWEEDEALELSEFIVKTARKFSKFVGVQTLEEFKGGIHEYMGNCGAGYRSIVIDPYGNVRACPFIPTIGPVLGSIVKDKYEDVFGSSLVHNFRKLRSPREDTCGECEKIAFCKGCALRALYCYENIKPDCAWAKKYNVGDWFDTTTIRDPYINQEEVSSKVLDIGIETC